jgi:thioredoxin-related protein
LKRRGFLASALSGGALSCLGARQVDAAPGGLPAAVSLKAELDVALRLGRPLVVMVSLDGCPFCKIVRDQHLRSMLREGQPVVQVDMRSPAQVLDFEGRATTHDELVKTWKVVAAPTLLFFGKGAREVAQRLEGSSIPDFYGAYLEQRLQAARLETAPINR